MKKTMEHEGNNYANCNWCFGTVTKGLLKSLDDLEVRGPSGYHPNDSIIENGQHTEKSPGDLRRLAVTQSPVKDHQLTNDFKKL